MNFMMMPLIQYPFLNHPVYYRKPICFTALSQATMRLVLLHLADAILPLTQRSHQLSRLEIDRNILYIELVSNLCCDLLFIS